MTTLYSLPSCSKTALALLQDKRKNAYFEKVLANCAVEKTISDHSDFPRKKQQIVFVNGHFAPALSSCDEIALEGLLLLPLKEAYPIYGALIDMQLQAALSSQKDPFALFSLGEANTPVLLHIEENRHTCLDIVYLQTKPACFSPVALQVYIEKDASCSVTTTIVAQKGVTSGCVSQNVLVSLEKNAKLSWYDDLRFGKQGTCTIGFAGSLQENAVLNKTSLHADAQRSIEDISVQLMGKKAYAEVASLLLCADAMRKNITVKMEHVHPNARSSQLIKILGAGSSKSSFSGKIYVHPAAQKTESYQSSQALILSEQASVVAMPNLEIFADDVKASHGATFANIDQKALFYLLSRGISKSLARKILICAFCKEVLEKLPEKMHLVHQRFVEEFVDNYVTEML